MAAIWCLVLTCLPLAMGMVECHTLPNKLPVPVFHPLDHGPSLSTLPGLNLAESTLVLFHFKQSSEFHLPGRLIYAIDVWHASANPLMCSGVAGGGTLAGKREPIHRLGRPCESNGRVSGPRMMLVMWEGGRRRRRGSGGCWAWLVLFSGTVWMRECRISTTLALQGPGTLCQVGLCVN